MQSYLRRSLIHHLEAWHRTGVLLSTDYAAPKEKEVPKVTLQYCLWPVFRLPAPSSFPQVGAQVGV